MGNCPESLPLYVYPQTFEESHVPHSMISPQQVLLSGLLLAHFVGGGGVNSEAIAVILVSGRS